MARIGRALAAVFLLTFTLVLPADPAAAAGTTVAPHLGRITLAPGGAEKQTLLWLRVATTTEDERHFAVTVDYTDAAKFAKVDLALGFAAGAAAARAVNTGALGTAETGTGSDCTNTGSTVTCQWDWYFPATEVLLPVAIMTASPLSTATDQDSAAVTVTAKIDDTAATDQSEIAVGTAVDLAADDGAEIPAAPGKTVDLLPTVHNAGTVAVEAPTLAISGPSALLGTTSYSNCRYGEDLILCSFDNASVAAGATYAPAQPFTLEPPADSVPGSVGEYEAGWLTSSDYQDFLDILPSADTDDLDKYIGPFGTGAELQLNQVTAAQDQPQSDVNNKNDSTTYTMTVSGTAMPDMAAIGAKRTAKLGGTVDFEVGMLNRGPGTLHPELYYNNQLSALVRLPGNVTASDIDPRCEEASEDGLAFLCALNRALGPGEKTMFSVSVDLDSRKGEAGSIDVADALATETAASVGAKAANAANNTAEIVVSATGSEATLPITGQRVAGTALSGLALIAIGLLLTVRRSRRRIGAHARGNSGRGRRAR
ncbi:LPXTG cell wall anchor domain-containing protein [Actinoplanes sp. CA-030573]|uniref:LPXTG cell wall anchor domain-containing protein n=1 Tax=Actinoplanes sp. CA-030573 TaxID=3239898 RepID=UPI003D92ECB3